MTPTGASTPGNAWCATAPPSSSTNQGRTPRRCELGDRLAARPAPKTSSSQPKESQTSWAGREARLEQPLDGLADRRPGSPCRRGCRGPRWPPSTMSAAKGGCCQGAPRRRARRRGGPSARPAARRPAPRQWKSSPWVWIRVSSRCSCSSGNWRSSSATNASKASVSTQRGVAVARRSGSGPAPGAWRPPGRGVESLAHGHGRNLAGAASAPRWTTLRRGALRRAARLGEPRRRRRRRRGGRS